MLRLGEDAARRPGLDDLAVLQDDELIAKRRNDAEVVRDEHQRHVGCQPLEQLDDAHTGGEIEGADRLVGEQQCRSCHDGAGYGDALALAAGELVRIAVDDIGLEPGGNQRLADERKVPAYIVFGDTTLRAMARHYPDTPGAMEGIPGMGEKKRAEFAEIFAAEIAGFLTANSRQAFE